LASRLRVAYFSPLPPAESGIADYSCELLPYLAKQLEITLFAAEPEIVTQELKAQFPLHAISSFPEMRFAFDLPLYHMGNSLHHEALYEMMRRFPGVMVLHDHRLHDVVGSLTAGKGDLLAYGQELGYVRGQEGLNFSRALKLKARGVALPPGRPSLRPESLSLSERLVDLSLGVIVHSAAVEQRLLAKHPEASVKIIPMLVIPYETESLRGQLPWAESDLLFASVGFVTAEKQIDVAINAFARLHEQFPNTRYLVVGKALQELGLPALVRQLGLEDSVFFTGYVSDMRSLVNWIATSDVMVNLRQPTHGETSGAVVRALAVGRPLIVYDYGWYAELPDEVAVKIPPQDEAALLEAFREFAGDKLLRQQMGQAGRVYAKETLDPETVARSFAHFLEELLAMFPNNATLTLA